MTGNCMSIDALGQLRQALCDPLKNKIISRDETIIGGLVLVLCDPDKRIVAEALEIILSLAAPLENRMFLKEFIGMQSQLTTLKNQSNETVKNLASQCWDRLNDEEAPMINTSSIPQQHQLKTRNTNLQSSHNNEQKKHCTKPLQLIKPAKFQTITLQIKGLNDKSDMDYCRQCLLTVKGVVSITFDLSRHRCIVRVRPELTAKMLAAVIQSSNTLIADQVLRDEYGQETILTLQTESVESDKENDSLPTYLSDEESPIKVDDKAIRRYGVADETAACGWLSSAASFLAKSFYW